MKNAFIVGMILLNAFLLYALIRTGSAAKQRMIAGADTSVCAMEKWDIRESTLSSVRYAGRPFFISDNARALLAPYSADSSKLFVRIQFPSCERCISQLVRSLKRNENRLGTTNIILVTEFHDDGEVAEFVRRYDLGGFRLFNIPELELCLDLKNFIGSYMFTLSPDFRAENLLVCSKHNDYMHDDYFTQLPGRAE